MESAEARKQGAPFAVSSGCIHRWSEYGDASAGSRPRWALSWTLTLEGQW